jgi:hypothetical protein
MPEPNEDTSNNPTQDGGTPTFEAWIEKQADDVKALYTAHIEGLRNTVKATRDERDAMRAQLKDLQAKAEKGSELEQTLAKMTAQLEASDKRANFVEEAVKPEIGCRNPKAAYALALADNLFDRQGRPDWTAIKAAAPELFGTQRAPGQAGNGTGGDPPPVDMNAWIRSARR